MNLARSLAAVLCCTLPLWGGGSPALSQTVTSHELALVDMRGGKKVLGTLPATASAPRLSADGRQVSFDLSDAAAQPGPTQRFVAELTNLEQRRPVPMADQQGTAQHGSDVSPDGRWRAYTSSETGHQEVWLEPVPQTGKRYRLTQDGGSQPLWSPDGEYLYFEHDSQIFRIELFTASEVPKASDPKALPIRGFVRSDVHRQFDLSADGKRFLMLFAMKPAAD